MRMWLIGLSIFLTSCLFAQEWQRVYLATYPRSGNHWMRYLIEEATHVVTSSVYQDPDKPHLPQLFAWQGYCTNQGYTGECRYPERGEIIVVKTHFPHLAAQVGDELEYSKAIQIVRHPIDCLYSLYLHSQNGRPPTPCMPRETLMGFIHTMRLFENYWSCKDNVLRVRYEDLYENPSSVLKEVLSFIGYVVEDSDIQRAVTCYPPQGGLLKHLKHYPQEDLEYIKVELAELMQKYDYHIP